MIDILVQRGRKYDDPVQIDMGRLSPYFRRQDGHCSIKRPLHILQTQLRASEMKKNTIGYEGGFVCSSFAIFVSGISAVSVQCRNYCHISLQTNTFVHAWYVVRVPNRDFVWHAVVYRKAKSFNLLWDKVKRWFSFHLHEFDNDQWKHSNFFLLLNLSCLRPCTKCVWVNGSVICLVELDLVMLWLNRPKGISTTCFQTVRSMVTKFVALYRILHC